MICSTLVVLSSAFTVAQVMLYKRNDSCFKLHVSFLAWLIMAGLAGQIISIVLDGMIVRWWQALLTMIFSFMIYQSGGNVSTILKGFKR